MNARLSLWGVELELNLFVNSKPDVAKAKPQAPRPEHPTAGEVVELVNKTFPEFRKKARYITIERERKINQITMTRFPTITDWTRHLLAVKNSKWFMDLLTGVDDIDDFQPIDKILFESAREVI